MVISMKAELVKNDIDSLWIPEIPLQTTMLFCARGGSQGSKTTFSYPMTSLHANKHIESSGLWLLISNDKKGCKQCHWRRLSLLMQCHTIWAPNPKNSAHLPRRHGLVATAILASIGWKMPGSVLCVSISAAIQAIYCSALDQDDERSDIWLQAKTFYAHSKWWTLERLPKRQIRQVPKSCLCTFEEISRPDDRQISGR